MTTYTIERPDDSERGIRVACSDHGESEEFDSGLRRVAFYCSGCGFELELTLHDTHEWREFSERC